MRGRAEAHPTCYDLKMPGVGGEAGFDAQEVALRALVSGISGREAAALAAFYDATASRVYSLALRMMGNRESAEEVTEDVYLQVWRRACDYDPARGKVTTWLYTLCRSRAIDQLRRRPPLVTGSEVELQEISDQGDGGADPFDTVSGLEQGSALHAALRTLGVVERQLLSLAYFKGLSHQEIAGHTGMPLGTVKTVLRKAVQALRERLGVDAESAPSFQPGPDKAGLLVS